MCGKFTAMASWARLVAWAEAIEAQRDATDDHSVSFRVMANLPMIVWDRDQQCRRVVAMRWGFPATTDWRRPQPIHARMETIDTMPAFADAFAGGQRGIVLARTFNEAPDEGEAHQHVVTPGDEKALGIAFVWRRFVIPGIPLPLLAACMVTVPANRLLASLPASRMPALLAPEDWSLWLGETQAPPARVKASLKTMEGVRWTMRREERAARGKRQKPTATDPGGLF
jgi:putative SOS response-associated peptidase YedK